MKKIFSFVKPYIKNYKIKMMGFIFICLILSGISMIIPFINGKFIDGLTNQMSVDIIFYFAGAFLLINILGLVLGYRRDRAYAVLQSKIGFDVDYAVIKHVQSLPYTVLQKYNSVYLSERISSDAMSLTIFSLNFFQNCIVNIASILLALFMVSFYSQWITLWIIILIPFYYLSYRGLKSHLFQENYKLRELQSVFAKHLNRQVSHVKFMKLHSVVGYFREKLEQVFHKSLEQVLKYQKISYLFQSVDGIISMLTQSFLILFAGINIVRGHMTIGEFTIISSYTAILMRGVKYFFTLGQTIQENLVSYQRLEDLMNIPEESDGGTELEDIKSIKVSIGEFKFGETSLLKNVNMEFQRGNIYVIKGENGVGKSTLCEIILGIYHANVDGAVKYNGIPIEDINMRKLRKEKIAVAEQNPLLLEDSLSKNFSVEENPDFQQINHYISIFKLAEVIKIHESGLEFSVNEKSDNFSGGERQKISIVRELAKNPEVMFLDEPTASLDKDSSKILLDLLEELKENKIIIIVTHDKDIMNRGDVLIDLENCEAE